jgi:hypothetical protein
MFGIGQITIALIRLIERGKQLVRDSETLIDPLPPIVRYRRICFHAVGRFGHEYVDANTVELHD